MSIRRFCIIALTSLFVFGFSPVASAQVVLDSTLYTWNPEDSSSTEIFDIDHETQLTVPKGNQFAIMSIVSHPQATDTNFLLFYEAETGYKHLNTLPGFIRDYEYSFGRIAYNVSIFEATEELSTTLILVALIDGYGYDYRIVTLDIVDEQLCELSGYDTYSQITEENGATAGSAIGDINGDGFGDVVQISYKNLTVFRDSNNLKDYETLSLVDDLHIERTGNILMEDIDQDGKDEIILVQSFINILTVIDNPSGKEGDWKVYNFATKLPRVTTSTTYLRLAAGDIDQDGDMDLVYSGKLTDRTSRVVFFENTSTEGQIQFQPVHAHDFPSTLQDASLPVIADLNNDRRPEVIIPLGKSLYNERSPLSLEVAVFFHNSNPDNGFDIGSPLIVPVQTEEPGYGYADQVFVRDVNRDGVKDLIVVVKDGYKGKEALYQVEPLSLNMTSRLLLDNLAAPGQTLRNVGLLDVDGDGIDELLLANWTEDYARIYKSTRGFYNYDLLSEPAYKIKVITRYDEETSNYPFGLVWGDVNGDGYLDFANQNKAYVTSSFRPLTSNISLSTAMCVEDNGYGYGF